MPVPTPPTQSTEPKNNESGAEGNAAPANPGNEHDGNPEGFPAETPIDEMTADQKLEYWKHKARKHEAAAKRRDDYDAILKERDELRAAGQSAEEKALEEARDEARREGENMGAGRYLTAAVRGELRASAPHLSTDEVDGLLGLIDPQKLLDTNGDVDTAKIQTAIGSLAPAPPQNQPGGQYQQTIDRLRQGGESAGSIAALQEQYHDKYKK